MNYKETTMAQDVSTNAPALERFLEIFSGKWTLLILRELFSSDSGFKRFGELRRQLHSISPKTLTDRLRTLEAQGIVSRTVYSEVPLHVEYRLTERGQRLRPIFAAMKEWVRSEDADPHV
jgi:DNA-binding HxlR family transcriptional regulator